MTEQRRSVFIANGEVEAQQVRAFLKAKGIPSFLMGETLRITHGLTIGPGGVEIFVAEADADHARSLLDSAEAGELRLDEHTDVSS